MAGARHVLRTVEQQQVGAVAVASGAADLLVVAFRAVRHVEVDDEAHVRPVDAHAESDCGDDDDRLAAAEACQAGAFLDRAEAGVEGDRGQVFLAQFGGGAFGFRTAAAVDDAGLALVGLKEVQQLRGFAELRFGGDVQVWAMEAGGEDVRVLHVECGEDVVAGARVGGGGECDAWDAGEDLGEALEVAVLGAEFMAPGADAVGFVDGDERQLAAAQAVERAGREQAFGGDVEQIQPAGIEKVGDAGGLARFELGVQGAGGDAKLAQRGDLVVHQRDQRGDDQGSAFAD